MNNHEKEASGKVMQLLSANWINQALYVAVKLEIPDILADGPQTIDKISQLTRTFTPYLYRLLRALASAGFFHEEEFRTFSLTPMSEVLQKNKMRSIALMFLSEWHNKAWSGLLHSIKTGETAFDTVFGKPSFEWLKEHPEAAEEFNEANEIKSMSVQLEITEVYDFSSVNSLIDVGGGFGGLILHLLRSYPHLTGSIADLPFMKESVDKNISLHNLDSRCKFIECDFFKKVPDGSGCYILSNILHDWNDEKCTIILENCNKVMSADSKLLVIESLLPERNEFSIASLLDLEVLVMGGGKERTESEYRELMDKSGFTIKKIINTPGGNSILECTKKDFN